MKRLLEIVGSFLLGLALVVVISFIPALLVMFLWNAIIPAIFSSPIITYWQAYGLYILCYILFKTSVSTTKD